jgi:hypothetical protein
MKNYSVQLPFSFGVADVQVKLTGRYGDQDGQANDRLLSATVASLLQLPQWLESAHTTDADDKSTRRQDKSTTDSTGTASVRTENSYGSIEVQLTIENSQAIREEIIQMVADAIASSVQNHADSAFLHVPATNDAFVQFERYFAASQIGQRMPVSAGMGAGQR